MPRQRTFKRPRAGRATFAAAAAALGVLLATSGASSAAAPRPTDVQFTVEMGSYWFSPAYFAVDLNQTVNFTLRNTADEPHEFEVIGYGVEAAAASHGNASLVFVANRTGMFTIVCGLPGHSTQGMVGRLLVLGPGFELNPVPEVAGQIVRLLEAVEREYENAGVANGTAANQREYLEANDFAAAAQTLWKSIEADARALDDSGAAKVTQAFPLLRQRIDGMQNTSAVQETAGLIIRKLREIGAASAAPASGTWQGHVAALRLGLAEVVDTYGRGDAEGADLLLGNVYLDHLEPLEGPVKAADPALKARLESLVIVDLRGLIRGGAAADELGVKWTEINATLLQVEATLSPPAPASQAPWLALGLVLGLILGSALGIIACGMYVRRLTAAKAGGSAAERPSAETPRKGRADP